MFRFGKEKNQNFENILLQVLSNNNTDLVKSKFSISDRNFDKFMAFIDGYLSEMVDYLKKESNFLNESMYKEIEGLLSAELLFKNEKFRNKIVTLLDNIYVLEKFYHKKDTNHIVQHYLDFAYEDSHIQVKYDKERGNLNIKYDFIEFYNENKIHYTNPHRSFQMKFMKNFIKAGLEVPSNDEITITNAIILLEKKKINFIKDENLFIEALKESNLHNLSIYSNFSYKNLMNKMFEPYQIFEVIQNKNECQLIPYFFDNHKDLIETKTKLLIDGIKPIYFPEKEYPKLLEIFNNIKYMKDLKQVEKLRDVVKDQLGLDKNDLCPIEDYDIKLESHVKKISKEDFEKTIKKDSYEETIISIFNNREDI